MHMSCPDATESHAARPRSNQLDRKGQIAEELRMRPPRRGRRLADGFLEVANREAGIEVI